MRGKEAGGPGLRQREQRWGCRQRDLATEEVVAGEDDGSSPERGTSTSADVSGVFPGGLPAQVSKGSWVQGA